MLLADDGSKGAARARAFAVMLATTTGARLTVVCVREPMETRADARDKLAGTLALMAAAGVKGDVIVEPPVGISNPGRRIVAAAKRRRESLIVLGARGAGVLRNLLGSVSSYVVSHANVTVCVVR